MIKNLLLRWPYFYPLIFALTYSQSPIFTANQNTKFISGLARAGYGDISSDWMAAITDPFPVFSTLLKWQYEWLGLHFGVHILFFIIVALYAALSLGIARHLFGIRETGPAAMGVFSFLWLLIHMEGFRADFLAWFPEGLGEQYLLGPYYQPCVFGVLILGGLLAYMQGRYLLAAICFILGPIFHPAYLISSAILLLVLSLFSGRGSTAPRFKRLMGCLLLVLISLGVYGFWSFNALTSGDPSIRAEAHRLLAETRISHHALPVEWDLYQTVAFFLISGLAGWVARGTLIGRLLLATLALTGFSVIWAAVSFNPTVAVAAPWRVSVFLAPLSWIVLAAYVAAWLRPKFLVFSQSWTHLLAGVAVLISIWAGAAGVHDFIEGYQRKTREDYYAVTQFMKRYHTPGNQYLIPPEEANIRLEAGVPVFANAKSHPSKDSEYLDWHQRILAAKSVYKGPEDQVWSQLVSLKNRGLITHVVWPQSKGDFPMQEKATRVYEDKDYSLWDMRTPSAGNKVREQTSQT